MLNTNDIEKNTIINGNSLEVLKSLPDNSIDWCVTSRPYYALRSYAPNLLRLKKDAPQWVVDRLNELNIKPYDFTKQ